MLEWESEMRKSEEMFGTKGWRQRLRKVPRKRCGMDGWALRDTQENVRIPRTKDPNSEEPHKEALRSPLKTCKCNK